MKPDEGAHFVPMVTIKLIAPTINITPRPTSVEADTHNRIRGIKANLCVGKILMVAERVIRTVKRERRKRGCCYLQDIQYSSHPILDIFSDLEQKRQFFHTHPQHCHLQEEHDHSR